MTQPGTMPYQANDDPPTGWRIAIDALPWSATTVEGQVLWYQKNGACPHCHHVDGIQMSVEASGVLGLGPQGLTDIFVRCRCTGGHQRPEGVIEGCGWGGYVAGPVV